MAMGVQHLTLGEDAIGGDLPTAGLVLLVGDPLYSLFQEQVDTASGI